MSNMIGIELAKAQISRGILKSIIEELTYLLPDIFEAAKDGVINAEEQVHLEAKTIEMIAHMFGKQPTHEQSTKIVEGIVELLKLVNVIKA